VMLWLVLFGGYLMAADQLQAARRQQPR
jgi:hypothetical protein